MAKKQTWSIIIFCYNEVGTIEGVTRAVAEVLRKISAKPNEILIVDDGSTDGSTRVIRKLEKKLPNVRAIFHPQNEGIGFSLRSGYFAAKYENICAVPADGQFDPLELMPFAQVPPKTFISFFRKKTERQNLYRFLISFCNQAYNRLLLGIHLEDVNWVKIYKRKALMSFDLRLKSSLIESEICSKLLIKKNKCLQYPSVYHKRVSGKAKAGSLKTFLQVLLELFPLTRIVWAFHRQMGKSSRNP